jgi:hypothetical protein
MSTIEELVAFLTRENKDAHGRNALAAPGVSKANGVAQPAVTRSAPAGTTAAETGQI